MLTGVALSVTDHHAVVFSRRELCRHADFARIAFFTVGGFAGECYAVFSGIGGVLPDLGVPAVNAAVQMVRGSVGSQFIVLSVKVKRSVGNAVGETSDGSAEMAAVLNILPDRVITKADFIFFSGGGWHKNGSDRCSVAQNGDFHSVGIMQCDFRNLDSFDCIKNTFGDHFETPIRYCSQ